MNISRAQAAQVAALFAIPTWTTPDEVLHALDQLVASDGLLRLRPAGAFLSYSATDRSFQLTDTAGGRHTSVIMAIVRSSAPPQDKRALANSYVGLLAT